MNVHRLRPTMKIITAIIIGLTCISVTAQNRIRYNPNSPDAQHERVLPEGYQPLKANHTIRLHGTTSAGEKVDLSVTGIGPDLTGDHLQKESVTVLKFVYKVYRKDNSYLIDYSIYSRVRVITSKSRQGDNYEYRDITTKGRIISDPAKDVEIYKDGIEGLYLSIRKPT